jgi:hypothetical protein
LLRMCCIVILFLTFDQRPGVTQPLATPTSRKMAARATLLARSPAVTPAPLRNQIGSSWQAPHPKPRGHASPHYPHGSQIDRSRYALRPKDKKHATSAKSESCHKT